MDSTRRSSWVTLGIFLTFLFGLSTRIAVAQTPTGSLQVTVVDATGAVIVGASVAVASLENQAAGPAIAPVETSDKGIATLPALAPGRYKVEAAFPGFETRVLDNVRVR